MRAVNLLPNASRSADAARGGSAVEPASASARQGAYAILGLLGVASAVVVSLTIVGNQVERAQGELDAVNAQVAVTRARAVELAPFGAFRDLASSRRETISSLATSRFDWDQALSDLGRAVPRDITVRAITGTVSSTGGGTSGGASNPLRSAIAAPAFELAGCAVDQRDVALFMDSLRGIRGVTRVSLSSSAKSDEQSTGRAPEGTEDTEPRTGCGEGSPPEFQVVAFFGGSKAQVTTDTAVAGGAPAAAPTPVASGTTAAPAGGSGSTPSPAPTPGAGGSAGTSTTDSTTAAQGTGN